MAYIPWGTIAKALLEVADAGLEYTDEDSAFYHDKKVLAQRMVDPLGSMPTKLMGAAGLNTKYREGDKYPIDDFTPLVEMIGNLGMGGSGGAGAGAGWMNAMGGMGGMISMASNKGRR